MKHGKSGASKPAKAAPKFDAHKTPKPGKEDSAKAALLARMKAAADNKTDD